MTRSECFLLLLLLLLLLLVLLLPLPIYSLLPLLFLLLPRSLSVALLSLRTRFCCNNYFMAGRKQLQKYKTADQ
jgi:hypothetical protein